MVLPAVLRSKLAMDTWNDLSTVCVYRLFGSIIKPEKVTKLMLILSNFSLQFYIFKKVGDRSLFSTTWRRHFDTALTGKFCINYLRIRM